MLPHLLTTSASAPALRTPAGESGVRCGRQGAAAVRREAAADLEDVHRRATRKRRRRPDPRMLQTAIEVLEELREGWMRKHDLMRRSYLTVKHKRELREWFDVLDRDGSGEIDAAELAQPLLSTGIARSSSEVDELVRRVDKDGSGEIGFSEFLAVLCPAAPQPQDGWDGGDGGSGGGDSSSAEATNKIAQLQEVKQASAGFPMSVVVSMERRHLLMEAVLGQLQSRSRVQDDISRKWSHAHHRKDKLALRRLRLQEDALEALRTRTNAYINAVDRATNFRRELQDIGGRTEVHSSRVGRSQASHPPETESQIPAGTSESDSQAAADPQAPAAGPGCRRAPPHEHPRPSTAGAGSTAPGTPGATGRTDSPDAAAGAAVTAAMAAGAPATPLRPDSKDSDNAGHSGFPPGSGSESRPRQNPTRLSGVISDSDGAQAPSEGREMVHCLY